LIAVFHHPPRVFSGIAMVGLVWPFSIRTTVT
jgi:hypothetical protein